MAQRKVSQRWVIVVISAAVAISLALAGDAYWFASRRITVSYVSLPSKEIPAALDGLSIACIGDLEYGTYMDQGRFQRIIDKLNALAPDVIIFLGDLYDKDYQSNADTDTLISGMLGSLKAPQGKFAVLGDYDASRYDLVSSLLYAGGFEVIDDRGLRLHNGTADYINLVGISTASAASGEVSALFTDIQDSAFTLAVSHEPDVVTVLPLNTTDVLAAANSHGSQITIPLYGPYKSVPGSTKYTAGRHYKNGTDIYDTRGLGTTGCDVRLLSDPEILFFRLKAQ